MIVTANHWFKQFGCSTWQAWMNEKILPHAERHGVTLCQGESGIILPAWVSRGRWSVTCPCGGGEYVWEEGYVFCFSCLNSHVHHQLVRSIFPNQRRAIEAILEFRPLENRHWLIKEPVSDLIAQNIEHDVEVPQWSGQHQPQGILAT